MEGKLSFWPPARRKQIEAGFSELIKTQDERNAELRALADTLSQNAEIVGEGVIRLERIQQAKLNQPEGGTHE